MNKTWAISSWISFLIAADMRSGAILARARRQLPQSADPRVMDRESDLSAIAARTSLVLTPFSAAIRKLHPDPHGEDGRRRNVPLARNRRRHVCAPILPTPFGP